MNQSEEPALQQVSTYRVAYLRTRTRQGHLKPARLPVRARLENAARQPRTPPAVRTARAGGVALPWG